MAVTCHLIPLQKGFCVLWAIGRQGEWNGERGGIGSCPAITDPNEPESHRLIRAGLAVFVGAYSAYWGWVRLAAGSQVETGIGLVVFGIVLAVAAVGLVKTTKWSFWVAMVGGLGITGSFLWALLVLGGEPILLSVVIVAAIVPVYLLVVRRSFGIGT